MHLRTHFALLSLLAAFAVAGAATISGTVTDAATDEPIPGAVVTARTGGGGGGTVRVDTAALDGGYSFDSLATGYYILSASATGYVTNTQYVSVQTAGASVTREIALQTQPMGTITGTITNSVTDEPVSGATVIAVRSTTVIDTVTTNAEGAYIFAEIPTTGNQSRYTISVRAATYLNASVGNLQVLENDTTVADLAIEPIGLRAGSIEGVITDSTSHEPIGGALIQLTRSLGGGNREFIDSMRTAADGSYSFTEVASQSGYRVEASAVNFVNNRRSNLTLDSAATLTVSFALVPIPVPTGAIRGVVTNASSGDTLAGITVVLRRSTGGGNTTPVDTVTTAAGGAFAFTALDGGGYSLTATAADYVNYTSPATIVLQNAQDSTVNIALQPILYGNMHILVGKESDGSAIQGASVSAALEVLGGAVFTGTTNAQGWVDFTKVIAGNYTVTVTAAGYVTETQARRVTEAEEDSAVVLLAAAGTVSGRLVQGVVTDTAGEPVEGASIVLQAGPTNSILTMTATSLADGAYEIAGIPLQYSSATITVTIDQYRTNTRTVNLNNDTVVADVELVPTPTVGARAAAELVSGIRLEGRMLFFVNIPTPTTVSVVALNGRTVMHTVVQTGTHSLRLPETNQALIMRLSRDGRTSVVKLPIR